MKAGKYRTGVITSLDQVPEGFVQITTMVDFDGTPDQKGRRRRLLSDAHQMGYVRAVKLFRSAGDHRTGPVFIDQAGAEEFIRWHEGRIEAAKREYEATLSADQSVVSAQKVVTAATQAAPATQELRELIDVTSRLISSIRDLQAAIELRSEVYSTGGHE